MAGDPYAQRGYRLRFEWGPAGAAALVTGSAVVAVVDVLSFTTTLTVAADLGVEVFPYPWRDDSATTFAEGLGAALAVSRSRAGPEQISLSPATVRRAGRQLAERGLVLPSPNGSTIAHTVAGTAGAGGALIGVSLRNRVAAAAWTASRLTRGDSIAVIAAGERWRDDGTLRPAAEDLWGAGGFLVALAGHGIGPASPEAELAMAAFGQVASRLPARLRECASGRELIGDGYADDVEVAAELDASEAAPVLSSTVHPARFVPAQRLT